MGPIDVYLVSQFEEKFEEMNGVEPSMSYPIASSSGSKDSPIADRSTQEKTGPGMGVLSPDGNRSSADLVASLDYTGGITKIVPADVDNDTDYWLISDPGVSIADMWQPDAGVEWDGANVFSEQFRMGDMGISQPQTTPSGVANVPQLPANAPSR